MEITANAIQTVQPASNVLFTETAVEGSASIIHREGSGLVILRGLTTTQDRARFRVVYGGNIAVPTGQTVGPISLAISFNGEPLAPTTVTQSPTNADRYNNVFGAVYLDVPAGCCTQIAVRNISTIPIEAQNMNLIVERVA